MFRCNCFFNLKQNILKQKPAERGSAQVSLKDLSKVVVSPKEKKK